MTAPDRPSAEQAAREWLRGHQLQGRALAASLAALLSEREAALEAQCAEARATANRLNRRIGELEHEKSGVALMAMRLSNSGSTRPAGNKTAAMVLAQELESALSQVAALREAWEKYRAAWNDFAVTPPDSESSRVGGDDCDEHLSQLADAFASTADAATAFVERIRASEREACAKVADEHVLNAKTMQRAIPIEDRRNGEWERIQHGVGMARALSAAIRARAAFDPQAGGQPE